MPYGIYGLQQVEDRPSRPTCFLGPELELNAVPARGATTKRLWAARMSVSRCKTWESHCVNLCGMDEGCSDTVNKPFGWNQFDHLYRTGECRLFVGHVQSHVSIRPTSAQPGKQLSVLGCSPRFLGENRLTKANGDVCGKQDKSGRSGAKSEPIAALQLLSAVAGARRLGAHSYVLHYNQSQDFLCLVAAGTAHLQSRERDPGQIIAQRLTKCPRFCVCIVGAILSTSGGQGSRAGLC